MAADEDEEGEAGEGGSPSDGGGGGGGAGEINAEDENAEDTEGMVFKKCPASLLLTTAMPLFPAPTTLLK